MIKHSIAVINAVWISISDPAEIFSKSSPTRIRFWIAEPVGSRSGNRIMFNTDQQHRCESKIITIRFAGWISCKILRFLPDTDIQKLILSGNLIQIMISETFYSIFWGIKLWYFGHFLPLKKLHIAQSFIIFGSTFLAFCAMPPSLSMG